MTPGDTRLQLEPRHAHADWSTLAGRSVYIWPDNDEAGKKSVSLIASRLQQVGAASVAFVPPPSGVAKSWDLADAELEGWDSDRARTHLQTASEKAAARVTGEKGLAKNLSVDARKHFRALGYEHDRFYFLTKRGRQVVSLSARSLRDRANLMMLAELGFWERAFPAKGGINIDGAVDCLIRDCYAVGVYDPDRLRGRGAWWDNGRPILHLGHQLLVHGEPLDVTKLDSEFIYEMGAPLRYELLEPLSDTHAEAFLQVCNMLLWERSISGLLLAGWCAVAPICGSLRWRPHIWLTSKAGSGKSWVMDNIIYRAVGELAVSVQSKTTEAGLRQELGGDARPVIFDEAEGEDLRARERMQGVIEFARACSSEGGADILKGTTSGSVKRYRARSTFAFSSINVQVRRFADETRFTVLTLLPPDLANEETKRAHERHFAELQSRVEELLTPDFASKLLARSLKLMPVIRRNAEIFGNVLSGQLGSRRLADQLGTLLAGAYSFKSGSEISQAEARDYVSQMDWSDHLPPQEAEDEQRLLATLLEHVTRVHPSAGLTIELSIGELIRAAAGLSEDHVSSGVADDHLKRVGLRVDADKDVLFISNTNSMIKHILERTPWAEGWSRLLKRLPGASTPKTSVRFAAGVKDRAVALRLSIIFPGLQDPDTR